MRATFGALAALIAGTGGMQAYLALVMPRAFAAEHWMLAGALELGAVFLVVVHFIRKRRFKRFDDAKKFD